MLPPVAASHSEDPSPQPTVAVPSYKKPSLPAEAAVTGHAPPMASHMCVPEPAVSLGVGWSGRYTFQAPCYRYLPGLEARGGYVLPKRALGCCPPGGSIGFTH